VGRWVVGWVRGTGPALAGNVGIGGAFALRARGGKVSTFLCSLRLSSAAASVAATANAISATATIAAPTTAPTALLGVLGERGSIGTGSKTSGVGRKVGRGLGPRDWSCARRERWDRRSFRAAREGEQDVDVPMLAPAQSRCCSGRRYCQCHFCHGYYCCSYYCSHCVAGGFGRKGINREDQSGQASRRIGVGLMGTGSGACGKGLGWEGWGLEGSGSELSDGL
jgi:hypothetical protein